GLKAGDAVVLNPKVLVGDQVRTRQAGDFNSKEGGATGDKQGAPGAASPNGQPAAPGAGPGGAGPGGVGPAPGPKPAGPGASGPGGPTAGGARPAFDPNDP